MKSSNVRMASLFIALATALAGSPRAGAAPAPDPATEDFPIGVWLQSPSNASAYRAIGINRYVGLWKGPTEAQLAALEQARMKLLCAQNAEALNPRWKDVVVGWLQDDEPDDSQATNHGYGPPIDPAEIVRRYHSMHDADSTRPVMLNLSQGVAWDQWYGRGPRTNKPEDYPKYLEGCDIASFDIYPFANKAGELISDKPWYVGRGVERLVRWTKGTKPVWAAIESTVIDNPNRKATPEDVRAEVWMALIHGAHGIMYFAHQFKPQFIEAGLLHDSEMSQQVGRIDAQIQELKEALNAAPEANGATTSGEVLAGHDPAVAVTTRRVGGNIYVFAVGMRNQVVDTTFTLPATPEGQTIEVIGENRTLRTTPSGWSDTFHGYEVHLYRLNIQ